MMAGQRKGHTSHFSRLHWHLNVVINVLHCLFVHFRWIQVPLHPEYSIVPRLYAGYVSVRYFSFTMTHINYVRKRDDIAGFERGYLAFLEQSQGRLEGQLKLMFFGIEWNIAILMQFLIAAEHGNVLGGGRVVELMSGKCATFMAFI